MEIRNKKSRRLVERVTVVSVPEYYSNLHVFELIDDQNIVNKRWIEDWGGDNITEDVKPEIIERIYKNLEEHYKA